MIESKYWESLEVRMKAFKAHGDKLREALERSGELTVANLLPLTTKRGVKQHEKKLVEFQEKAIAELFSDVSYTVSSKTRTVDDDFPIAVIRNAREGAKYGIIAESTIKKL